MFNLEDAIKNKKNLSQDDKELITSFLRVIANFEEYHIQENIDKVIERAVKDG